MRGKRENESSELEVIGFRRLTSCKLPVFRSNVKLQVTGFGQTITWNAPVSAGVESCAAPEICESTANTSVVNGEKDGRKGEFSFQGLFFGEIPDCGGGENQGPGTRDQGTGNREQGTGNRKSLAGVRAYPRSRWRPGMRMFDFGGLLHGEGDRARCRNCAGRAGHGDGVGSCRGTGIAATTSASASTSAASKDAACESHEERQHSEHGAPATPPRGDAEEQQAGQRRAAGCVPGNSREFGMHQRRAGGCCGGDRQGRRSWVGAGNADRAGGAEAQRGR